MNQIIGWLLAAALLLAAMTGVLGYYKGSVDAKKTAEIAMKKHLAEDAKAESDAKDSARLVERELVVDSNAVAAAYEQGKEDAEAAAAAVVADLRSGSLQLRKHWAGCETARLSGAAARAGELDALARDREESAGRIVRAADECDAHVRGLQEVLTLERD